jgi:hypothetical protein
MPWASLVAMTDADLGSIYAYVRSLDVSGPMQPDPLPPTATPPQPFIVMVPGGGPPAGGAAGTAPVTRP